MQPGATLVFYIQVIPVQSGKQMTTNSRCLKSRWNETDKNLCESGGRFKNTYELLNLRALNFSPKIHIFQCMDKIFCVEFQRVHTLKDTMYNFYRILKF